MFGYGSLTVQDLFEKYRELFMHPFEALNWLSTPSPVQVIEAQLLLVQRLQLMGLGMAVLGAIMLAYGLWAKKENK